MIGAIARRAESEVDVVIVSSDKDMLQLVDEHVSMLNPAKDNEWYDPAKVQEFMGVPPSMVADLLALKGDAVDNIPGAPGIGDKGAREIISKFGSAEAALDRAAEVERKMYRESLLNNREQVLLSKRLATIDTSAPVEWTLDSLRGADAGREQLAPVLQGDGVLQHAPGAGAGGGHHGQAVPHAGVAGSARGVGWRRCRRTARWPSPSGPGPRANWNWRRWGWRRGRVRVWRSRHSGWTGCGRYWRIRNE